MITIEQLRKKQALLKNGWKVGFDCYGKDQVKKTIDYGDNEKIICTLYFSEEFDKTTFRHTGLNLIMINISLWRENGEFWTSSGLGKTYTAENKYTRKMFKYLALESEKITDDFILSSAIINEKRLRDGRIL